MGHPPAGCIQFKQENQDIDFSSVYQTMATGSGNLGLTAVSLMHELGHALGLTESPDPASVMKQGSGPCANPIIGGATAVQGRDAADAATCQQHAKLVRNPPPLPPPPPVSDGGGGGGESAAKNCYIYYTDVTEYDLGDDGEYHYVDSWREYDYSTC